MSVDNTRRSGGRSSNDLQARNYEIGYGKPPRQHQFKKGTSGNPKGRRKGARNEATILRELMEQKVEVRQSGKTRKFIVLEALLRKLVDDAFKNNHNAMKLVLDRYRSIAAAHEAEQVGLITDDMTAQEASDIYARMLGRNPPKRFKK